MIKTNAMRLLTTAKIPFETVEYQVGEDDLSGVHTAEMLGTDPDCMFKTLVARGASKGIYVFCIPVAENLDLKKAARAVGEKSIEMVQVKEINGLTGKLSWDASGAVTKDPTVYVIKDGAYAMVE